MSEKRGGWLQRLIPRYAWLPIAVWFVLNCSVYFGARLINRNAVYHDFTLPIDREIPMAPAFILIYVFAYVTWFAGFILICREGKEHCGPVFGEIIAKLICFVVFITVPTCMEKPPVTESGFFGWLCRFIFSFDEPNTLMPSIHCLENWVVWRGMAECPGIPKSVKAFFLVYALLVFASTLLLKQHVIVDIPSAILVGEIGLFAARKLHLGRRYAARYAAGR